MPPKHMSDKKATVNVSESMTGLAAILKELFSDQCSSEQIQVHASKNA